MKDRTAKLVIVALAMVCVVMVFSVVYPFSTSNPEKSNPSFSTDEDADAFRVTGSAIVDGELSYGMEAIVTADNEQYGVIRGSTGRSEVYQRAPDSEVYKRVKFPAEESEERLDRIEGDDEEELLRAERDGDRMTIVTVEAHSGGMISSPQGELFVTSLEITEYERVEDRGGTLVYEPRDGWYEAATHITVEDPYRVTDSAGRVEIDADTHVVESANVSFVLTEGADTYAHYAAAALTEDDERVEAEQTTYEIAYEFDDEDPELDVPDWVEEARDER